ncbi:MAG: protein-L-isoaspartate(D-aspartate) O-methyltransferase [Longimicrobiales bacterium]
MAAVALNDQRFERQRRQLVEIIRDKGIENLEILRAFSTVPRHLFLPTAVEHRAYEDAALPIGFGQTTSQPSLQALFMERIELEPTDRVLEVGTGMGYQTAVLAQLVSRVYSIDRIPELTLRARAVLDSLRIANVALLTGDGTVGWSRYAPFDAILVAAGAPEIPAALVTQLATGGRMLIPLGDRTEQQLTLVRKSETGVETEELAGCAFVPLIGRFAWPAT